ncbi:3,4-dihydroxy-2-butanone-4-phosphate synthase [Halobacteriales archaeon SW_5_68_122]|nr:MAG: 3,4-dihydroxy-2-butanone-4-phosphate synthase [Halobacteriales archaeon SW_5_68_122]
MSRSSDTVGARRGVEAAVAAFAAGEPVLIHDAADREGEVDLVYPAAAVDAGDVARMRNDAGGLVCVALPDDVCATWGLPFVQETIDHPAAASHDLSYDDRSSFSLTVNHRDSFTGITDADRALTISELGGAAAAVRRATAMAGDAAHGAVDAGPEAFAERFRAPGHVHLLRAAPDLLADREGHTELGVALADAAGVEPAVVVCEMLDDEGADALPPAGARAYADRHGLVYVEGAELLARFG